jgi:hypothetical protein
MLSTYWLVVKAALPSVVRYVKNSLRSPEKLVISLWATNEYTVVAPLGPEKRFHACPPIVGVSMGVEPVVEMGPAPPMAASQTMISNSFEPVAVLEVNIS